MSRWSLAAVVALAAGSWSESSAQTSREAAPGRTIDARSTEHPLSFVVGMTRAPDSSLLILDPPQKLLLRFSPRGEYRGRIGREGDGPGEFRWPLALGTVGDQVWVADHGLQRVTFFDRAFKVDTTRTIERSGHTVPMGEGSFVIQPTVPRTSPDEDVSKQAQSLDLVKGDGSQVTIGSWIVNATTVSVPVPGMVSAMPQPFTDRPLWAVAPGGGRVVVIEGSSMKVVTASGAEVFRKTLAWPRVPVTSVMYEKAVDSLVEGGRSHSFRCSRDALYGDGRVGREGGRRR